MKTVLIKIFQDVVWFNPSMKLLLSQTNLPFKHFKFSERPIYWLLEMKSFDKQTSTLDVKVIDFKAIKVDSWIAQKPKSEVLKINFLHLDWSEFCACLAFYQSEARDLLPYDEQTESEANIKLHQHDITLPLSALKIGFGHVFFTKKFKWSDEKIEIRIDHPFMVPEFEYIKPYFSKVLNKRTIDVTLDLKISDSVVSILNARSEDLQKINNDAIYVLKTYRIDELKRNIKDSYKDRILFDLDSLTDDQNFGNIDIFERDILFHVLENDSVRNIAQLNYLSDILLDTQKLMFTMEPQFGFIFVINGFEMVHCVWELLDSHATYVWSFDSKIFDSRVLKMLEREFTIIAQFGRSHYRNNVVNSEQMYFNIVQHNHSDDPIIDHFGKWKLQLERLFI